jgi:chromosome condensin MukBEF complex kleisin-like MukF subunit
MALTNTSINEIYKSIQTPMKNTESDLKVLLDTVPTGGDITTAQLLQLQTAISKYTLTSTIFSAIIKELSDSLKQTAAKIG